MEIFKICGAVLIVIVMASVLKHVGSPVYTALICAGCVCIAAYSIPRITDIVESATSFADNSELSSTFPIILKITAVALICELTAGICEGSGENALSKALISVGRIEIIFLSLPMIESLFMSAVSLCEV